MNTNNILKHIFKGIFKNIYYGYIIKHRKIKILKEVMDFLLLNDKDVFEFELIKVYI